MIMPFDIFRLMCVALAGGALVAAAVSDALSYQIPNRFAVAIAFSFLAASLGGSLHEALTGLAIGAIVFAIGIALFARRLLGGGDVKLLAATALWVPPPLFAAFTLVTSLAGAALGIVMLSPLRRWLPAAPLRLLSDGTTASALRQPMPFGVAIATGGLFALLSRLHG
jgi:prepilin peptidase CpaA